MRVPVPHEEVDERLTELLRCHGRPVRFAASPREAPPGRAASAFAGEHGRFVDEADAVAPRVRSIERTLAPRARDDLAAARPVHVLARERFEAARQVNVDLVGAVK